MLLKDLCTILALFAGLAALLTSRLRRVTPIINHQLFTKEKLSSFKGDDNSSIYLAIVGHVYDVTKGRDYYGADGGYSGFAGRDGSRAFVTGNFTEAGLVEEIEDLTDQQISEIWEWLSFYKKEQKYTFLGYVEGIYFDKDGSQLPVFDACHIRVEKHKRKKMHEKDLKSGHPTCNSRWEQGKGSKLWCDEGRVPRKWFLDPQKDSSACHCFADSDVVPAEGRIEVYKNCDVSASTCSFPPPPQI